MNNLLNSPAIQKMLLKFPLSNKRAVVIIAALLIITIYIDYTLFISRQIKSLTSLGPRIVKLKKDVDGLGKNLLKMQDIKNKQAQISKKLILKLKKIISDQDKPSLLQNISDLANKNEVKIIQFKFSPEAPAAKQAKSAAAVKFSPLLISLDLACDYHRLGKFINDLENAQVLMVMQNIKVASQPADYLRQKVNLVLLTYVKK